MLSRYARALGMPAHAVSNVFAHELLRSTPPSNSRLLRAVLFQVGHEQLRPIAVRVARLHRRDAGVQIGEVVLLVVPLPLVEPVDLVLLD